MATIGTLNRRLGKVETKAAELESGKDAAFEVYALLFLGHGRTSEARRAIAETLLFAVWNDSPTQISGETRGMMEQARKSARAAIRAAGETTLTPALFEQSIYEFCRAHDARGVSEEWAESQRNNKRTLSQLSRAVTGVLWVRSKMHNELWDNFLRPAVV